MKYLLIPFLAVFLTACSGIDTTNRTLSVIESTANLKYYYETGEAVDYLDNAQLTQLEKSIITDSINTIKASNEALSFYEDHPEQIVLNIQKISYEYSKIKSAYLSIREIVLENQSEYSNIEWQVFVEVDSAANMLNTQFEDLVDAAEANAALMTAIRLGNVAVKLSTLL